MEIEPIYISASVNQTKRSLDWNKSLNLIAYAACNQIFLFDPEQGRVIGVSNESHGVITTCVFWIKNSFANKCTLLSTSSDGSAKLWSVCCDKNKYFVKPSIKLLTKLEGHKGSVNAGYALFLPATADNKKPTIFVVTTGEDNFIKGWRVELETGFSEEVLSYKLPGRSLALELLLISPEGLWKDNCWPLIIYGGDDAKVHILTSENGIEYKESGTLSGHEDWIMSLDYIIDDAKDILLATGAKNGLIRLWRMSHKLSTSSESPKTLQVKRLKMLIPIINTNGEASVEISLMLESVLLSHEGLVSHLDWSPKREESNEAMRLLSCSKTEDRSIIIWEPDLSETAGVWLEKTRLGEVGGNREGFFNAKFGPDGKKIVATSYQGGLHIWHLIEETWQQQPVVSGHFNEVTDLDWDVDGRYLLTTSKDQTTRLHALWKKHNGDKIWQEIARPQVHGFDMSCIASLDKYRFVSGAEEKVIRGFTSTATFVRNLQALSSTPSKTDTDTLNLPEFASVPSLGLSNKGVDQSNGKGEITDQLCGKFGVVEPPTESQLMSSTLWPEVAKLYGHGNEIISLASSSDGTLVASACRAAADLDAIIILWDTKEWKQVGTLHHHRLSVTQMMFSSCNDYLLSVSRDRSWAIFGKDKTNSFKLKSHSGNLNKTSQHGRIIWSCCWLPGTIKFLTASRDKTVVVWKPVSNSNEDPQVPNGWEREAVSSEEDEITAVAAISLQDYGRNNQFLVAIGSASGALCCKLYDNSTCKFVGFQQVVRPSHRKTIRRLKFNPRQLEGNSFLLASCGCDNSVIIYSINL